VQVDQLVCSVSVFSDVQHIHAVARFAGDFVDKCSTHVAAVNVAESIRL
jgi:hypothetical protein